MNVLVLLAIVLFALMAWVGGMKGVRSFIALFINFLIVLMAVFVMNDPSGNPIIIALIAVGFISAVSLFFINQVNNKTMLAFFSDDCNDGYLNLFHYYSDRTINDLRTRRRRVWRNNHVQCSYRS